MKPAARTCCFCLKQRGVMPYTIALRALGIRHADYAHDRCLRAARRAHEQANQKEEVPR